MMAVTISRDHPKNITKTVIPTSQKTMTNKRNRNTSGMRGHATHVPAEMSHTHVTHVSVEMSHTHMTQVSAEDESHKRLAPRPKGYIRRGFPPSWKKYFIFGIFLPYEKTLPTYERSY